MLLGRYILPSGTLGNVLISNGYVCCSFSSSGQSLILYLLNFLLMDFYTF